MLPTFQKYQLFFRLYHILVLWKKLVRDNLHGNKMSKDKNEQPMPPPQDRIALHQLMCSSSSICTGATCRFQSKAAQA